MVKGRSLISRSAKPGRTASAKTYRNIFGWKICRKTIEFIFFFHRILLEQMKKPTDYDDAMVAKSTIIELEESTITEDSDLYLLTWSPDPKELPHADFNIQHQFSVDILADYLRSCCNGLICVESTQLGNPHYHGWYQVSANPDKEKMRIVYAKVLQRLGLLKITKSKGCYRINSYTKHGNCLHYYKKDLLESMLFVENNPITAYSKCDIDWELNNFFFYAEGKKSVYNVKDKITNKEFYKQFYKDSEPL